MAQKKVTKKVRALRRMAHRHAVDALYNMSVLLKSDPETDFASLQRMTKALQEVCVEMRIAWPTWEHVGVKKLGDKTYTVGN